MFQREIQFIIDYSTNKVKNLGNKISLPDLVKADIHPAIIKSIAGQVGIMINSDRQKILKESLFDYSSKTIQKYLNLIDEELKKTSKIDTALIIKGINISVSFHINHLVRPKFTMLKYLFNKEDVKNVYELKLLLNHFYYYDYFTNLIKEYINKKKIEILSLSEFEELYDRIDKLLIDTYSKAIFESHVNGICDFINIGDVNKSKMLLNTFELFLGEKGLTEYILALKENYGDDLKLKIDKNEVLNFIKNNPLEVVRQNFKYKIEKNISESVIPENLQIKKEENEEQVKTDEQTELIDENVGLSNENTQEEISLENNEQISEESFSNKSEDIIENVLSEEEIEQNVNLDIDEKTDDKPLDKFTDDEEEKSSKTEENYDYEETDVASEELITETGDTGFGDNNNAEKVEQSNIEEIILEESVEYNFETVESKEEDNTIEISGETISKYETEENNKEYIEELIEEELQIEFKNFEKEEENFDPIDEETVKDNVNYNGNNKVNEQINSFETELKESSIDVNRLMDEKDINKIVRNLFNDDYEDFAEHLEKMGQLESIDEIMTYINTYCNNFGISENKKEVILFKKLITHNFNR
jgi:hypothetical protein